MSEPWDDSEHVLVRFDHLIAESDLSYGVAIELADDEPTWLPKAEISRIDLDNGEV